MMSTKRLSLICALVCLMSSIGEAAISANTVREIRTTGAQTNGSGFVTGASGTDYSQQDAAQYALTGVTTAAADAICLSASSAAVMVGNICYIVSGTSFTVGWYEIVSVVAGVSFTLDRNCTTAAGASGVINIGGAFLLGGTLDDEFTESLVAGNTVHVKSGTYTLSEAISQLVDGTAVLPITWIGYTTTRNDACVGTNRPLWACGIYSVTFGDYSIGKNMRFTGTASSIVLTGDHSTFINCKSQNTSATAGRDAFYGSSASFISCEAISDNGEAIYSLGSPILVNCYIHNSVNGVQFTSNDTEIIGCIIDTCTTGILYGAAAEDALVIHSTIYNCGTGISGGASQSGTFLNNIITGCTTGASWTTEQKINVWDYNCWNNTSDVSNVTKGPHDITADPLLTDPANADFTLASGSPCFNTGLKPSSDIGLP